MISRSIIIFGILFSGSVILGYGQNSFAAPRAGSIDGTVVYVNWVAKTIVVRTLDFDNYTHTETFIVTQDTEITQGEDTLSFSDLHQASKVRVTYAAATDSSAGATATHIEVLR